MPAMKGPPRNPPDSVGMPASGFRPKHLEEPMRRILLSGLFLLLPAAAHAQAQGGPDAPKPPADAATPPDAAKPAAQLGPARFGFRRCPLGIGL
jgi:hypothetical protein